MSEIANDVKFSTIEVVSNLGVNFSANDTRIKHTGSGELIMSSTVGDLTFTTGGTSSNALTINAPSGGIDINSGGKISIDTTSVDGGIHIGTSTAGIPVIIGTSTTSATIAGDLVVTGNLTVNGDSVTNNVITYTSNDSIFYLNDGETGANTKDIGLIGERGTNANVGWIWNESSYEWAAVGTDVTEADDGIVNIVNYNQIRCGGLAVVTDSTREGLTDFDVNINGYIGFSTTDNENNSINMTSAGGIRLRPSGYSVQIDPSNSEHSESNDGHVLHIDSNTITDSSTAEGGTADVFHSVKIEAPIVDSLNISVTTTTANTVYISGAPISSENQTFTNAYALNANGATRIGGPLLITGAVDILSTVTMGDNLDMNEYNIINNGNLATDTISPRLNDMAINVNHNRAVALEIKDTLNNSYVVIDTTDGDECVQLNRDIILRSGEALTMSHTANANGEDLTIAQAGAFDASLLLTSAGTGTDAIGLTASAGGINIESGTIGTVIHSTGHVNITSNEAASDAIFIQNDHEDGGIEMYAGTGSFDLQSDGVISLRSYGTTADFRITHEGAEDSDIQIRCIEGSLNLTGGEANTEAVKIEANHAAGGVRIYSGTGGIGLNSSGYVNITNGSGGFTINSNSIVDINAVGSLTLDSTATGVPSNLTHVGSPDNDLTVSCTAGSLNLTGGEAHTEAVKIEASHTDGGIKINSGTGGIDIDTTGFFYINTGSGGIDIISDGNISLNSNSTVNTCNLTHAGSPGNDLRVECVSGSLNLISGEAVGNAVSIDASNAAGGVEIDAGTGGITVDTAGALILDAVDGFSLDSSGTGAESNITHVGGAGNDLTVSCTGGSLNLIGGEAISNAVAISTSHGDGGIDIDAGAGGIAIDTTGSLSLDSSATTASSNLTHVGGVGHDLTVECVSGSLNLVSGEAAIDAIKLDARDNAGGIDINAGTGGITIDTTGSLSLDSSAITAPSNLTHVGSAGNDLTVSCTSGSLNLLGGEAINNAVRINTTNAAGGIDIDAGTGGITMDSTGVIDISATGALTLDSSAAGASSNLTHTGSAGNDLTVSCTSGSLNLRGGEAINNAITINTTNVAGGIDIDAGTGGLTIDTTGTLSLDSSATGAGSNLTHVGSVGNDLTVSCGAGSLLLRGGEAAVDAVRINAFDTAGGVDMDAGTGGITIDTTGSLSLDSSATAASSNLTHVGSAGNDLTVSCTSGSLNLLGGEAINNAVRINTTNAAGGIDIDAGTGGIAVDSTGVIDINATGALTLDSSATGASSNLTHAGGAGNDLLVSCTLGSLNLRGGEAAVDAVKINTTHANGGIDIDAGTGGLTIDTTGALSLTGNAATNTAVKINSNNAAGGIDIDSGTGGITIDTTGALDVTVGTGGITFNTSGTFSIDSTIAAGASNITHIGASGQDLTVSCTNGSLILAAGENVADAVRINASDTDGGIDIDAGTGGITIDTTGPLSLTNATSGITIDTSGTFSIDSSTSGGASNVTHLGSAGNDLTVSCTGGSLNLSAGEAINNAIRINTINAAGGIDIDAGTGGIAIDTTGSLNLTGNSATNNAVRINSNNAAGGIDIDAGTGGIAIDTTGALSLDSSATTASSNLTHAGGAGHDLTVSCTNGSLNLTAGEAANNAITITAGAGGIDINASTGGITIDTSGAISIDSEAGGAPSNLTHVGSAGNDLTVSCTNGSLNLRGGEAINNAITINTTNVAGGIDIDGGTGGIAIDTTGSLSLDSSLTTGSSNLTHAGGVGHDLTVSCTNGSLNLTAGEAANNAIAITASAGGITMSTTSQVSITGDLLTTSSIGSPGTNVTAVEHGTSRLHLSVLTLTNVDLGAIAGAGNEAKGVLIYTLPAGAIVVKNSYMSIGLTNTTGNINGDTPVIGIGTSVANGAVSVLGGTPQFEDVLTGQIAVNVTGTATVKTTIPQLIIESADDHTIYLNIADGWAGVDASVKANGNVVLEWTHMEGTLLG
jgi:hypothetical protein